MKIMKCATGNSRFVAVILALLMSFISVPAYASETVISTGEPNQFQAVKQYVPGEDTASAQDIQPAVQADSSSFSYTYNTNPLSLPESASEGGQTEKNAASSGDTAALQGRSLQSQGLHQYQAIDSNPGETYTYSYDPTNGVSYTYQVPVSLSDMANFLADGSTYTNVEDSRIIKVPDLVQDPTQNKSYAAISEKDESLVIQLTPDDYQILGKFLDNVFTEAYLDASGRVQKETSYRVDDPVEFIRNYLNDPTHVEYETQIANRLKEILVRDPNTSEGKNIETFLSDTRGVVDVFDAHINRFFSSSKGSDGASGRNSGTSPSSLQTGGALSPAKPRVVFAVTAPGQSVQTAHPMSYMEHIFDRIGQGHMNVIMDNIGKAQQNLGQAALSEPFSDAQRRNETERTAVEHVSPADFYTEDSVYIDSFFLRVQKILNPPEALHPYLKWVLYGRNLTAKDLARYLKVLKRLIELQEKAKAEGGMFRYRGKVYDTVFFKFPEAVGNVEFVRPIQRN